MTDDTREQIGRDSKEYASTHLGSNGTYYDKETAFRAGAERQHPIAFEQGRIQGKFEAIDHILESMQAGHVQTWIAAIRHLEGLKEAAIRTLKN